MATSLKIDIPLWEFVAMMAMLLALNALAIDTMLPALAEIGQFYEVENANDQQLVIFAYILGFGIPQLFFGPISDRFGRKGLLQISLIGYSVTAFMCMAANSFEMLLGIRFLQGVFSAGARVIAGAVIRDVTSGRVMAKVMSLVLTVFMIVPILAPGLGTIVMHFTHWKWTFGVLGVAGFMTFFWTLLRLPKTLPADKRRSLDLKSITSAYWTVMTTRVTVGYMAASGIIFGALFAFIGASEQIFDVAFGKGEKFWLWFAIIALMLAIANFVNSRIVERIGMRRISHGVMLAFIVLSITNLMAMQVTGENFYVFLILFSLTFACFGMMGANFASLALEPLGEMSGTANAAYGFATSTVSSLIGLIVARQFDGTITPILSGFLALGIASLLVVLLTEKGKLFELGKGKS